MREYIVTGLDAGQRLDKYLSRKLPLAPRSFFYRMLRKKNITLNRHKSDGSEKLANGDHIELFLSDETIEKFSGTAKAVVPAQKSVSLDIIYEDSDILLVNKPSGMLSQKAQPDDVSLTELIIEHALASEKLTKEQLLTCRPSVCNRLDRNTSGIVCAGLSVQGLQFLSELFRTRDIHKYYYALVRGRLEKSCRVSGWLYKDEDSNRVTVKKDLSELPQGMREGARFIETEYEPVCYGENATLLKILLVTGRSHQIRAHLAFLKHPVIGDTKYGDADVNRLYKDKAGVRSQLLHAGMIVFPGLADASESLRPFSDTFSYLDNKSFSAALPSEFMRALRLSKISCEVTAEKRG